MILPGFNVFFCHYSAMFSVSSILKSDRSFKAFNQFLSSSRLLSSRFSVFTATILLLFDFSFNQKFFVRNST